MAEAKQELSYLVKPFRGKKSLSVSPAIKEYRSFHGQFARCVFFKDRVYVVKKPSWRDPNESKTDLFSWHDSVRKEIDDDKWTRIKSLSRACQGLTHVCITYICSNVLHTHLQIFVPHNPFNVISMTFHFFSYFSSMRTIITA